MTVPFQMWVMLEVMVLLPAGPALPVPLQVLLTLVLLNRVLWRLLVTRP